MLMTDLLGLGRDGMRRKMTFLNEREFLKLEDLKMWGFDKVGVEWFIYGEGEFLKFVFCFIIG